MTFFCSLLLSAITVGAWNGKWFPSGRAEHRAPAEVEAHTVKAAAKMIRSALDKCDPAGTNDVILCLNEMRAGGCVEDLCSSIGLTNLKVAVTTAYRRRDRLDMQQDAILTTLPVVSANWARWKLEKGYGNTPPRGYALARVVVDGSVTAKVYCVHLKSNYGQKTAADKRMNRKKRERAVGQLVQSESSKRGRKKAPVIVAGDFNCDKWSGDFSGEQTLDMLSAAGFSTGMDSTPASKRETYAKRGKWKGATLDYIFYRGFSSVSANGAMVVESDGISDHNAVFEIVELCNR